MDIKITNWEGDQTPTRFDTQIIDAAKVDDFSLTIKHFEGVTPKGNIDYGVYNIIENYTRRGFNVSFNKQSGELTFRWSNPSITFQNQNEYFFANPSYLDSLSVGFSASLLYLCMTNGEDLTMLTADLFKKKVRELYKRGEIRGSRYIKINYGVINPTLITKLYKDEIGDLLGEGYNFMREGSEFRVEWSPFYLRAKTGESLQCTI